MPTRSSRPQGPSHKTGRGTEPLWRRVVFGRMWKPKTIVVTLAGCFGAMMIGVSLGNSAISQINPIHFQGAALHPRDRGAAVDPNRPAVIANNYEQLYGWSQGFQARTAECPGCSFERPAEPAVRVASVSYFGSREEEARRQQRERREIDAAYERRNEEAERRRALAASVVRYTEYRVSEEEAVRERPYYARNDVVLTDADDNQE